MALDLRGLRLSTPARERRAARHALIVEDDRRFRELLRMCLTSAGYRVEECADGRGAMRLLRQRRFDLVILDVMLPCLDGLSICRRVRAGGPNLETPIVMVTARGGETATVSGLESGADDYIVKPFAVREFLARVGAVTRRCGRQSGIETRVARSRSVAVDAARRVVTVRSVVVDLTRQEFDLLHFLVRRPGIVVSRRALAESVWQDDHDVSERTVDAVVSRLRRKIERDRARPELIITAWGVGYKFADAE